MAEPAEPTADDPATRPIRNSRRISGRIVVIGMAILGLTATAVMFLYWDLHTKPFRSLTEAIGRTYKYSLPKVEGGRHKRGPMTLRVALRVPFAPETDQPAAEGAINTICRLIGEHQDLAEYDLVQIHFFQMVPEAVVKSKRFEFTPEEVRQRGMKTQ